MYSVNFASEINEIISEVKYLEQLGFTVPELARNMALQEKKYGQFRDGLTNMLTRYERIMSSLNDAELDLLQDRIWIMILQIFCYDITDIFYFYQTWTRDKRKILILGTNKTASTNITKWSYKIKLEHSRYKRVCRQMWKDDW